MGADVAITVTVDNPKPTVGEVGSLPIPAKDNGPGNASGIVVQELLTTGYTFSSKSVFSGSYDEPTGVWNVGALTKGQAGTMVVRATVNASGNYTNTAT